MPFLYESFYFFFYSVAYTKLPLLLYPVLKQLLATVQSSEPKDRYSDTIYCQLFSLLPYLLMTSKNIETLGNWKETTHLELSSYLMDDIYAHMNVFFSSLKKEVMISCCQSFAHSLFVFYNGILCFYFLYLDLSKILSYLMSKFFLPPFENVKNIKVFLYILKEVIHLFYYEKRTNEKTMKKQLDFDIYKLDEFFVYIDHESDWLKDRLLPSKPSRTAMENLFVLLFLLCQHKTSSISVCIHLFLFIL